MPCLQFWFSLIDLLAVRALAVHFETDFVILNPDGTVNVLPADPDILYASEIEIPTLYRHFGQDENLAFVDYFMQEHKNMPVVLLYSGGPGEEPGSSGSYHYDLAMPLPVVSINITFILHIIISPFRWLLLLELHNNLCQCHQRLHRIRKQFFAAMNHQYFFNLKHLLHLNQQMSYFCQ